MKKIILGLIVLVSSLSVFAAGKAAVEGKKEVKKFARPYGMAGCGLGSIVLGKHGSQVLAATTNGTGSNQFFGITFGTSNCIDGASSEVANKSDFYIRANRLAVQMDMARGNGETLAGLSEIMGCRDSQTFGRIMQKNYSNIFIGEKPVTNEITDSIITVIQNDEELVNLCQVG